VGFVKDLKYKYLVITVLALVCTLFFTKKAEAQQQKRAIQLSGIVMDTVAGPLPGVHVYIPKAGRGVTTNAVGFFSLVVLPGDSIVISSVGYKRRHYIVEESEKEFVTIIVPMVEDVTYLEAITIIPYPTEEVFKEAVLALNLPADKSIDDKNMNQELLALMLKTTPMDGTMNQRYALSQWASTQNDRFQPVTNPFLNPFNWVKFFNGLKKDKKK
jgi:hypothetical protein